MRPAIPCGRAAAAERHPFNFEGASRSSDVCDPDGKLSHVGVGPSRFVSLGAALAGLPHLRIRSGDPSEPIIQREDAITSLGLL
jgi:hypothetical protein